MFYPFKPARGSRPQARQLSKLHAKIAKAQRLWADRLNERARKLSPGRLKVLLIVTGFAATAAAAGLIYRGIIPQELTIHRFELPTPVLPGLIHVPESPGKQQALDFYLDSLEKAFIFDSIQNSKPPISHDSTTLH
ncbi:MAG TPA: hypothetical protein VN038_20300 [Dyadobacter sp.]|nr:hypothetical protein [Dyadobacter sp.]